MAAETITLTFDDKTQQVVSVDVEESSIGGAGSHSTVLKVTDAGPPGSPLRKAAEKTLRPSGAIGVTISARTERIAKAVQAALQQAATSQVKPPIRIAPNSKPV